MDNVARLTTFEVACALPFSVPAVIQKASGVHGAASRCRPSAITGSRSGPSKTCACARQSPTHRLGRGGGQLRRLPLSCPTARTADRLRLHRVRGGASSSCTIAGPAGVEMPAGKVAQFEHLGHTSGPRSEAMGGHVPCGRGPAGRERGSACIHEGFSFRLPW